ncbi:hypothetical protein BDV10DRAFT_164682 [Aspergillus recurvatus]
MFNSALFLAKCSLTDGQPEGEAPRSSYPGGIPFHCSYGEHLAKAFESIPGIAIHITDYISIVGWGGTLAGAMDTVFAKLVSLHQK